MPNKKTKEASNIKPASTKSNIGHSIQKKQRYSIVITPGNVKIRKVRSGLTMRDVKTEKFIPCKKSRASSSSSGPMNIRFPDENRLNSEVEASFIRNRGLLRELAKH